MQHFFLVGMGFMWPIFSRGVNRGGLIFWTDFPFSKSWKKHSANQKSCVVSDILMELLLGCLGP